MKGGEIRDSKMSYIYLFPDKIFHATSLSSICFMLDGDVRVFWQIFQAWSSSESEFSFALAVAALLSD